MNLTGARLSVLTGGVFGLRKDPEAVPEIVPEGEEAASNELADLGRKAKPAFHSIENEVVEQEGIERRIDNVATRREGNLTRTLGAKHPVALHEEVKKDTNRVTDQVGPKQANVVIEQHNEDVTAPEPDATTDQIFDELDEESTGTLIHMPSLLTLTPIVPKTFAFCILCFPLTGCKVL